MYEISSRSNCYLEAVKDICRAVKLHNPLSLVKVTESDILEYAKMLQEKYPAQLIEQAKKDTLDYYSDSHLTLGKLQEVCNALWRAEQNENATKEHLKTPKELQRDIAKENITKIKQMLSEANIPRKLPYNKDKYWGEFYGGEEKNNKQQKLPRYEACNFDMPIWGKACYSHGPSLYAKCVAVGHILPIEVIQEPELRELYQKAWTIGLEKDEKARFDELAKAGGYA